MGVDRPIDITTEQRKTLLALLKRHLPNTTAWVYGSRVKWTSRPQSDLDLVVFTKPDHERRVSELREAFEESNLPFRVDLFVWDAVPEPFRKEIEAEHVVLVERGEQGVAGEWREIPLAQLLAEPVRNGIYKKKEFHGRGTKIVNMGELFAHPRLPAVPMKRVELSESEAHRFLIAAGDLLFARRSLVAEGAGKCCVVLDVDEPTTFESSIIRVRLDSSKADYLYLYYFFNSALGLYHLDTIRRHVAVAGITGSDLAKIEIPVPPLSEQRAIAHVLGTLDDKIELNRRMNETLEAMARALFKSWFIDFDPVRAKAALRNHSPLEGESARQGRSPQPSRWGDEGRSQDESLSGKGCPPPHQPSPRGSTSATPPQGGSDWTVERARAYLDNMPQHLADLFPDRLVDSELGPIPEGWAVETLGAHIELAYGKALKAGERKNGSIPVYGSNGQVGWHDERLVAGPGIVVGRKGNPGVVMWAHSDFFPIDTTFYVVPKNTNQRLPFLFFTLAAQDLPSVSADSAVPGLNRNLAYMNSQLVPDKMLIDEFSNCANAIFARRYLLDEESRSLATLRDALLPKLISGEIRIHKAEIQMEAIV